MDNISKENIIEVINLIARGVDPVTGEILDMEELKASKDFKNALKQLNKAYRFKASGSRYRRYEEEYPDCAVIMKEGFFYSAHDMSAVVLNRVLDYRLAYDMFGRVTTGGPDPDKIADALKADDFNFVLAEKDTVLVHHEGRNPFTFLNITEDDLILPTERIFMDESPKKMDTTDVAVQGKKSIVKNKNVYPKDLIRELFVDGSGLPEDIEQRLDTAIEAVPFSDEKDQYLLQKRLKEGCSVKELEDTYGCELGHIARITDKCLHFLQRRNTYEFLLGNAEHIDME